jgi:hypothetical protein
MLDVSQRRRLVSPALLLAALLCFFLPFFSVSCTSGVGQMKATVTGMDQVFGGEPEYTGFRPPPSATGGIAAGGENNGVSPSALVGFAAIVVGIGVGLGLPRARDRWVSGAVDSGIALVGVVVNQTLVHDRAREGLDRAESTFRSQLGDNPIFGQSFPMPVFDLEDEFGFWVVTMLLGLVLAYNVWELVALQRLSNRGSAPLSSANSAEPGWPQGPPPHGLR